MRVDMVLIDLDGTLLDAGKQVSDKDKKILWDISNVGIFIGYVTSRTGRRIHELIGDLPCDCMALLNGGDIRMLHAQNDLRFFDGIDGQLAVDLLDDLYENEGGDIAGFFDQYELWDRRIIKNGHIIGDYHDCKKLLKDHHCQRIRIYGRVLNPKTDRSEIFMYHENGDTVFESRLVNKKSAVNVLCRLLEILPENVIAFGDSELDIPMFESVGTGIAMANASDKVKNSAKEVTLSNEESGVGEYLEHRFGLKAHIHSDSLKEDKCVFLLKDVKGLVPVITAEEKRRRLEKGLDSQDCLAKDPVVMPETVKLFREKAVENSAQIAECVGRLAEKLYYDSGGRLVLVSLARGGIMTGSLCKRYIERYYRQRVPHYTLSLVRGVGIDENALSDIVKRHGDRRIRFIDGWTGSGFISTELEHFVSKYNTKKCTAINCGLSVLADTSYICQMYGTREDIFLPECCLNSTICGLLSSVSLNGITSSDDYHGAIILDELSSEDQTEWYYELICKNMKKVEVATVYGEPEFYGKRLQQKICEELGLDSAKKVRLGLGESTRAIFRTTLSEILVKDPQKEDNAYILHLAREKGISIRQYDTGNYNCIAILET